jgi:hypothetical protein
MIVAQDSGTTRAAAGDLVRLKLDPAQVHLFDSNGTTVHGSR